MVLEVTRYRLFARLRFNEFVEAVHVELRADGNHSLVPADELIFNFDPKVLSAFFDLRSKLLPVRVHVRKDVRDLLLSNFIGEHGFDRVLVDFLVEEVQDLLKSHIVIIDHVLHHSEVSAATNSTSEVH